MKNSLKIILTTLGLSVFWFVVGLIFVPLKAIDHFENYFYITLSYTVVFFLPLSILLFSNSVKLKRISWVFVIISILAICFAIALYFMIKDFQRNGTIFDIIYSIPLYLGLFGASI